MIITVSGLIGSGKSTLAKELADRFNLRYISPGMIMRDMAKKRGMTLLEFSKYAEKNPEIDEEIDKLQKRLSRNGYCVVDGRLSSYFIDSDLKIWLRASLDVRARRISDRDKIPLELARKGILERERSERLRYKKFYGIDLDNLDIYDIILNTDKFDAREMTEIISTAVRLRMKNRE
ncbi:MAG: cytidylate kinase [Candidatus Altiarchaeales archaeon]|nr:MAG: cytidylate kinase [Candidatus Altiarchaeales archaeon]